jgi:hypothetical protein
MADRTCSGCERLTKGHPRPWGEDCYYISTGTVPPEENNAIDKDHKVRTRFILPGIVQVRLMSSGVSYGPTSLSIERVSKA